jgi:hypothetical protein
MFLGLVRKHCANSMQGVERLSIVSKVLCDSRLFELRRENDALKLEQKQRTDALKRKVFWLHHDDLKLKQHLAWANDCDTGPNCCCAGCYWNGRFDYTDEPKAIEPEVDCTFMPWFEDVIVNFGMSSSVGNGMDVTTHFALHDAVEIEFARWLLEIPTCEHPEQRKVAELFAHFSALAGQIEQPDQWESYWR